MGKRDVDKSRYKPKREAVFTETMRIGIVLRELDAALRRYVDDGVGPWQAAWQEQGCDWGSLQEWISQRLDVGRRLRRKSLNL